MIRCRVLGGLELRDDDAGELSPVLAQPKRFALLAYLLVADARRFHRRDTLMGLFWPELDESRARDNLNQALRFLRQSLGSAIVSRGLDEVGIDATIIWCDASAFSDLLRSGRVADALELYDGDLLPGFFIADAPEFEQWLEKTRAELRTDAANAARELAERCADERNLTFAVIWARRAASLAADDERAFRRLLKLLANAGDRAGALQAYDDFARRLRTEFEAEPAAETTALIEQIRRDPTAVVASPALQLPGPPLPAPAAPVDGGEGAFTDEPLTAGDSLADGRYVIERPLGAGGMAAVYLARDVRHERSVAVKVLRAEIATLAGRRALLHEIRIAAALQHPHIVPLFDSGESRGRVFYVMPYVVGESLRARIARSSQMPIDEAVRLLRDVATALSYAHKSAIVHCDIKPENILLAGDSSTGATHAMVADFGIAKALHVSQSQPGKANESSLAALRPLGTPGYMAPEQAAGGPVDRPVDVYAWGLVAYEVLAGAHPFAGRTSPHALLAAQVGERPTPVATRRADLPVRLATLVMRCLEKEPAARPPDGAALLEALDGAIDSGLGGAWRRLRRGGVRRTASIAALAMVAAAGMWMVANVSRRGELDAMGTAKEGRLAPSATLADPSHIAVLSFEDLTPGDTLEHVANGITTYLTDELAAVPGLTVASVDAARRLRREEISLDSMARWLGSRSLVTGSVDGHNDTLAVTVRLVDGISGQQLASVEERRASRDLFQLQRDLALSISGVLRTRLGHEVRLREDARGTRSVEAWNLMQQARSLRENELWFESSVPESLYLQYFDRAESMLVRAQRLDPAWSAPHVEHSIIAHRRSTFEERHARTRAGGSRGERSSPAFWRAEALWHAEAALGAAPSDPAAHLARGRAWYLLWRGSTNAPDSLARLAEADLRTAAETKPASGAWSDLSTLYRLLGRFPEAAIASERAVASDAFLRWSQDVAQELVANALFLGHFDDARQHCTDARRRFPRDPRVIDCDLMILGWTGDRPADAEQVWRLIAEREREDSAGFLPTTRPFRRVYAAAVLARAGLRDSAEAVVGRARAELERVGLASAIDFWESYVHVLAGRPGDAVARLTSYLATNPAYRGLVANTPWFRSLQSDSAFVKLVASRPGS